jgi:hypothetical protein
VTVWPNSSTCESAHPSRPSTVFVPCLILLLLLLLWLLSMLLLLASGAY